MIKAILVFNNHGKPRLTKFYQFYPEDSQQQIIRETFQLVSKRDDNVCNFLEGGTLIGGSDYKIIYRHYATLYFVFCVDSSESELGILDLIQIRENWKVVENFQYVKFWEKSGSVQNCAVTACAAKQVFVETLDKCFENVCELDLIFHVDKVHYILNELVMGGMVLETNMTEIIGRIEDQNKIEKQEAGLSAAPARAVSALKNIKDIKLPSLPPPAETFSF
ncbi:AP-3 complex subunit sigma-2-like isoform X1 [Ornithodoros turicata]|uniref:AP-3 complex subunit sigma-2-like isoform X1 n=1 Tax=Ornithodoros turicata TaxID=34597 RepID=UPI003139167A